MKRKKVYIKNKKYSGLATSDSNSRKKKRRILLEIILYFFEIVLVIGFAYALVNHGFIRSSMVGDSMVGTLNNGDEVIINKLVYRMSSPKRNDIVAYSKNLGHGNISFKRVIGLPGEKVLIKEGKVFIDGEELIEDIEVEPMKTGGLAEEEITLEENEFFLLGDNRNKSEDSRFSEIGTIVRKEIIGKVWIKLKPFGFVNNN